MDNAVFLAVLFAAACHAGWNALIKVGLNPLSTTTIISLGAGLVSVALVPFLAMPASASWPWLFVSIVVHIFYFTALIESYRTGDLGQVYPIARGTAPLMTATATVVLFGETLGVWAWSGICVLVAGVVLLSVRGQRAGERIDPRAIGFALATAATICTYSVVDGIGARLSGQPVSYTLWMTIGTTLVMGPYAFIREGWAMLPAIRATWWRGVIGGAMQLLSYSVALWAMTRAPIAIVATLRETSVLFGALLAVVILKEPLRPVRIGAAMLILCGLVLIRLA